MRSMILALAKIGVGIVLTGAAHADQVDIPSAYVVAAEDNGIPPEILYSVASAESQLSLDHGPRPWPWTLNVAGKSMRFGDSDSACQALMDALEETQIVDVGIAQLNVRWQPQLFGPGKRFADPCEGLNPYANLDEAAALIRGHYEDSGDWLIAAGRYHRPAGGPHAERYRGVVGRQLARLGPTPSMGEATPELLGVREMPVRASLSAIETTSPTASPTVAAPGMMNDDLLSEDNLTWVTPAPRSPELDSADITWVTPEKRIWMAEVAIR